MNFVPGVKRVPGVTWIRPPCSFSVAGSTHLHAPSRSLTKCLMKLRIAFS